MAVRKNKLGFTLVELSIVLVIIGLLIGGILVAQSLIDSTKINKLGQDMFGYKTVAILFKERYKHWPGDNYSGCTSESKNGYIGPHPGSAGCALAEPSSLWADLSSYGMIEGTYTAGYYSGSSPGHNPIIDYYGDAEEIVNPATEGRDPGLIVSYSGLALGTAAAADYTIYGINLNSIRTSTMGSTQGFHDVYEAISFEKKFDDSHPGTGDVSISSHGFLSCVDGNNATPKESITWDITTRTDADICIIHVWLDY